ncbi:hypothetical protein C8Q76DRAFT_693902 [Earliella scabrosa]|nr:hypothetical protein C8Q76DRAFT_693902 [Earliella scabrosa]
MSLQDNVHLSQLSPEILRHIVEFIPVPHERQDYFDFKENATLRHTLMSLTVTCRVLSEAALNRLWAKLPNILPLIYTLPRGLWTVPEGVRREKGRAEMMSEKEYVTYELSLRTPRELRFTREIVPGDCTRLLIYAPRVKSIYEKLLRSDEIHTTVYPILKGVYLRHDVLPALESVLSKTPVLPKLRTLTFNLGPNLTIPTAAFISSTLTTVKIVSHEPFGPSQEQDLADAVQQMQTWCPNLNALTCALDPGTDRLRVLLAPVILQVKHLTSFSSRRMPITIPTLLALSQLRSLRYLRTYVDYEGSTIAFPPMSFPALRELELTTATGDVATDVLRAVISTNLSRLDVSVRKDVPRSEFPSLFSSVAWYVHLSDLTLDVDCEEAIPSSDLAPLLCLPHLTSVNMARCPIALNDELMRRIAISWRKLTYLRITVKCKMRPYPGLISLLGLAYLVHGCKKLDGAGLPLDATCTRVHPSLAGLPFALGARTSCPLKVLYVGESPIRDPVPIAAYLSDILPNLSSVSTGSRHHAEEGAASAGPFPVSRERLAYLRRWYGVTTLIPLFVRVREQERRRIEDGEVRGVLRTPLWNDRKRDMLGLALDSAQVQAVTCNVSHDALTRDAAFRTMCREEGYALTIPPRG